MRGYKVESDADLLWRTSYSSSGNKPITPKKYMYFVPRTMLSTLWAIKNAEYLTQGRERGECHVEGKYSGRSELEFSLNNLG